VSDVDAIEIDIPSPVVIEVLVPTFPEVTEVIIPPLEVEVVELPPAPVTLVVTLDAHDEAAYWYGGLRGTAWKVNRFTVDTFERTSAGAARNPDYLTLADAWADRDTLVYG
jgi:hypothetical protein